MKHRLAFTVLATVLSAALVTPEAAMARHRHHYRHHGRYAYRCSGGNGAVGTVVGGAGGAVIGHEAVGGPVATVAGGVGGALLGRHLDKENTRRRHGC